MSDLTAGKMRHGAAFAGKTTPVYYENRGKEYSHFSTKYNKEVIGIITKEKRGFTWVEFQGEKSKFIRRFKNY